VGFSDRLKRLEERGGRCPECGLAPNERRPMAVIYDDPDRGFQGDPYERCARCGRPMWTLIRVVYGEEGEGAVADA
jgi:DNA-directed RNA polymerase subunit RPC12/RpoP